MSYASRLKLANINSPVAVYELDSTDQLPFTEIEDYVLQDNYTRYVVGSGKYVLWLRMANELPELMGRSPKDLRARWLELNARGSGVSDFRHLQPPLLENWAWADKEGISSRSMIGNIHFYQGLAEGSEITTAPVCLNNCQIEDQYISTECGTVFQLGKPKETPTFLQIHTPLQTNSEILKVIALAGTGVALVSLLSHHLNVSVFVV